jgi:DNA-binding SARP family transcriptional activator
MSRFLSPPRFAKASCGMLQLHIRLLGEFSLAYGDAPLTTVNTLRLQSLLAYLLLHQNAPQSRQHLAFLLWPDSSEYQARTNLRHVLHQIRHALPDTDRFFLIDTQTIQWNPTAPFALDVLDYERAVQRAAARSDLETAVELYHGDLLPSCYDDWVRPERERLHQMYIRALEQLIQMHENRRDYSRAIAYAQQLLHGDPVHEDTYRRLMRLQVFLIF